MKKVFKWDSKQGIYVDEHGLTTYHINYINSIKV